MYSLKSFLCFVNETFGKTSPIQIELRNKYQNIDVIEKLTLIEDAQGGLEINMLRITPNKRGQGYAQQIMDRIMEYADDFDKICHLSPTDEFGSDKNRLTDFYKGFGFVMNSGKNKDFRFKSSMIRYPNKQ
jgi:GNAT superfamily N-acetyltransferase